MREWGVLVAERPHDAHEAGDEAADQRHEARAADRRKQHDAPDGLDERRPVLWAHETRIQYIHTHYSSELREGRSERERTGARAREHSGAAEARDGLRQHHLALARAARLRLRAVPDARQQAHALPVARLHAAVARGRTRRPVAPHAPSARC